MSQTVLDCIKTSSNNVILNYALSSKLSLFCSERACVYEVGGHIREELLAAELRITDYLPANKDRVDIRVIWAIRI